MIINSVYNHIYCLNISLIELPYYHIYFRLNFFSNLSPVTTETSIENDKCCNGAQIKNSLFPHSCESHSAKQISCLSVDNCSKLLYLEETKVHHLSSISMDWTLLIDRQAANCRNTSDEVFPRIYLGDRYEKYSYHLTLKSFHWLLI